METTNAQLRRRRRCCSARRRSFIWDAAVMQVDMFRPSACAAASTNRSLRRTTRPLGRRRRREIRHMTRNSNNDNSGNSSVGSRSDDEAMGRRQSWANEESSEAGGSVG
ncbi:unnamed protein product [Trichogramma brassicae]|uniref:Uncharacterized protein n=1 Tax=Trichogramma brassicae TaxID=86971 RepID=A0A6H5I0T7_9HYME|nr:unnamed protein product [Trichogramma brassicae]